MWSSLVPRALSVAAAVAVATIAWLALGSPPLNYDTAYALLWARDLVEGAPPDYEALGAPTPHPALTLLAAPATLLGDDADTALRALGYLSLGALVVVLFWLGVAIGSPAAGAIAAALVATSPLVLLLGATAAKDILFCVLVIGALVLELRRPRRGVPCLVLLTVAGLLRPEAWLLAAGYWLYIWPAAAPRARAVSAGVALAAPAIWMLSDFAVTGQPLFSLTRTRTLTEQLGRETGLASVPSALAEGLADIVTWPALVAGLAGIAVGMRVVPRRMAPVAVLFGLAVAAFIAVGVAGLPLGARYLLLPGMPLAAAAGFLAAAWHADGRGMRSPWAVAAGVTIVSLAVAGPGRAGDLDAMAKDLQREEDMAAALVSLNDQPAAEAALRGCARIYFRPGVYDALVPYLSYELRRDANDFAPLGEGDPGAGALVESAVEDEIVPPGYRAVAARGTWRVYAHACGQGARETRLAASAVMSAQPRSR